MTAVGAGTLPIAEILAAESYAYLSELECAR
jgi:hypothetical protein